MTRDGRAWRLPAVVLALVGLAACNGVSGNLTSTETPLGTWTFSPTRCTADANDLVLSSRSDPLRFVSLQRGGAAEIDPSGNVTAASILSPAGAPISMTVLNLNAGDGAPLVVRSSRCRVLSLQASPSFTTRINGGPRVTSYSGKADIDCPYPDDAHRFVGHFDFTCYEE